MGALLITKRRELRERLDQLRSQGQQVGLVPTMGALHEGHLSLISRARRNCDVVVTTVFVNPTQFGPTEDFDAYPRQLESDYEKASSAGADMIFAPSVDEMYPESSATTVTVSGITSGLCGGSRPGHFDGVTTVVAKLFHVVGPAKAFFGKKDYQQLKVIEAMARDLFFPMQVVGCPTVREKDGLAMSSRNTYLSAAEREKALFLYRGLKAAREDYLKGERQCSRFIRRVEMSLNFPEIEVDYIELRDADDLSPFEETLNRPAVLAAAIKIGDTRLIDNVVLSEAAESPEEN